VTYCPAIYLPPECSALLTPIRCSAVFSISIVDAILNQEFQLANYHLKSKRPDL
jgi:hypothetical protein